MSRGGTLKCPKHGSIFSAEGVVTKGPARKPLDRFGVSIDDAGHVIVDPRPFPQGAMGKAGGFVEVGS